MILASGSSNLLELLKPSKHVRILILAILRYLETPDIYFTKCNDGLSMEHITPMSYVTEYMARYVHMICIYVRIVHGKLHSEFP